MEFHYIIFLSSALYNISFLYSNLSSAWHSLSVWGAEHLLYSIFLTLQKIMYVHIHASHVQVEIHDLYQNMKNEGFQSWVQTPDISEIEYEGSVWLVLQ